MIGDDIYLQNPAGSACDMTMRFAVAMSIRSTMFLLMLTAMAPVGCGPRDATVTGVVKFKNEPLPSGTVLFHGADGRIKHGLITDGGRYVIADAPIGPVRISVKSHAAAPTSIPMRGPPPPAAPPELAPPTRSAQQVVAIPPRYNDPDTSRLTVSVRRGKQGHDIDLEP